MTEDIINDVTQEMVVDNAEDIVVPGLSFESFDGEEDAPDQARLANVSLQWPAAGINDPLFDLGMAELPSGLIEFPFDYTDSSPHHGTVERSKPSREGEAGPDVHIGRFDPSAGKKAIVKPEENVVIDDDNKKVLVIPPHMHCKWHTQLHKSSDGTVWSLIFHINHGRIGHAQVEIMGSPKTAKFKGRRYDIKGHIKKIHKNKDGVIVILEKNGKPRILIYDIEHNTGKIKYKDKSGKWRVKGFSL